MLAVIFEVLPTKDGKDQYLAIAADLRKLLENRPGFISIERFQSLANPDKLLSLSFWESEQAIHAWRNVLEHRTAQKSGMSELFAEYRIRVAYVLRDYTKTERDQVPPDSRDALG